MDDAAAVQSLHNQTLSTNHRLLSPCHTYSTCNGHSFPPCCMFSLYESPHASSWNVPTRFPNMIKLSNCVSFLPLNKHFTSQISPNPLFLPLSIVFCGQRPTVLFFSNAPTMEGKTTDKYTVNGVQRHRHVEQTIVSQSTTCEVWMGGSSLPLHSGGLCSDACFHWLLECLK